MNMTKETQNKKTAQSQTPQGFQSEPCPQFQTGKRIVAKNGALQSPLLWRGKGEAFPFTTGKAPPDMARRPGKGRGHPPENKAGPPASPLSFQREGQGVSSQTTFYIKNQNMNTNTTINFITILNFKIMKKQFLILALFVLAAFASVTNSYGQTPLAPSPGIPYNYAVTINGASGATGKTFQFWITKDTNLNGTHETAGTDFIVNTGAATYDASTNTVNHINLTWTVASTSSTTAYYLVVKYVENNGVCDVENMKVWQIKPINTFYLAIVPSTSTGATVATADAHQCVAGLVSANITKVDADTTKSEVTYVYGTNTLYYKVTAAGMLGTWRPDIQLPAVSGTAAQGQNYKTARWNTKSDGSGTWYPFTGAAGAAPTSATGYQSDNANLATITDAKNGSSILIEIVVDNKSFETLSDQAITVGIDGYLPSAFSTSDVVSDTNTATEAAFGKKATNTILARPTATGTTVKFVTKNP